MLMLELVFLFYFIVKNVMKKKFSFRNLTNECFKELPRPNRTFLIIKLKKISLRPL